MAKGLFMQGVCLLTDGTTSLDELCDCLAAGGFPVVKRNAAAPTWQMGGPAALVAYRPEVNGYLQVDVVDHPWPDAMGDPKTDSDTFTAWVMGNFGPCAYPGGLSRAAEHCWAWEPGRTIAQSHRGFVRLRISYVFGSGGNAMVAPQDYEPLAELQFLLRVARVLLDLPSVICYFNPNGEVLRDRDGFVELLDDCQQKELLPLPLWMNVRFFQIDSELCLMDTVGCRQLDLSDAQAIFSDRQNDPGQVDRYLWNVLLYLIGLERPLKTGEEIDGPNETNLTWRIDVFEESVLVPPPRPVVRLSPKAIQKRLAAVLKSAGFES